MPSIRTCKNDLAIVITANSNNPSILNKDFLERHNIISAGWNLSAAPVNIEVMSQLVFDNGVSIISEHDKVTFNHSLDDAEFTNAKSIDLAKKYCEVVNLVEYGAIGINPRSNCFLGDDIDSFTLLNELIAIGPWKSYSKGMQRASVAFNYIVKGYELNLTINPLADRKSISFSGNFHKNIEANFYGDTSCKVIVQLVNWERDVKAFLELRQSILNALLKGESIG